ncbi:hypothetical protein HanPSC8_Chr13g0548981 [Helianthus annuus]|nr:hypothetical protein HanPSC8_Chr13g0548981 [Helianthus annuus]
MREALDQLPEMRLQAALKLAAQNNWMSRIENRRVRHRPLIEGDLVLRRTTAVGKVNVHGKFTANRESPYQICEQVAPGSYKLMTVEGEPLKNSFNADVLKKYFVSILSLAICFVRKASRAQV